MNIPDSIRPQLRCEKCDEAFDVLICTDTREISHDSCPLCGHELDVEKVIKDEIDAAEHYCSGADDDYWE